MIEYIVPGSAGSHNDNMSFEYCFGSAVMEALMKPLPLGWRRPLIKKKDGHWSSTIECTHPWTLRLVKIEGIGPDPRMAWASMRWQIKGVLP